MLVVCLVVAAGVVFATWSETDGVVVPICNFPTRWPWMSMLCRDHDDDDELLM